MNCHYIMNRILVCLGSSSLFTLIFAGPCPAASLRVPGEYFTIQAAVAAAGHNDIVLVAAGLYSGPGNPDIDLPYGMTEHTINESFTWPNPSEETLHGIYFWGGMLNENSTQIQGGEPGKAWWLFGYGLE